MCLLRRMGGRRALRGGECCHNLGAGAAAGAQPGASHRSIACRLRTRPGVPSRPPCAAGTPASRAVGCTPGAARPRRRRRSRPGARASPGCGRARTRPRPAAWRCRGPDRLGTPVWVITICPPSAGSRAGPRSHRRGIEAVRSAVVANFPAGAPGGRVARVVAGRGLVRHGRSCALGQCTTRRHQRLSRLPWLWRSWVPMLPWIGLLRLSPACSSSALASAPGDWNPRRRRGRAADRAPATVAAGGRVRAWRPAAPGCWPGPVPG